MVRQRWLGASAALQSPITVERTKEASYMRPGKLPPANLVSSKVVLQFPNTYSKVAPAAEVRPSFDHLACYGRHGDGAPRTGPQGQPIPSPHPSRACPSPSCLCRQRLGPNDDIRQMAVGPESRCSRSQVLWHPSVGTQLARSVDEGGRISKSQCRAGKVLHRKCLIEGAQFAQGIVVNGIGAYSESSSQR